MRKFWVRLICCFIPKQSARRRFRHRYLPHEIPEYEIVGNNNVLYFGNTQTTKCRDGVFIRIRGNNNKIFLPDGDYFQNCYIDIRANNSEIRIGKPRNKLENIGITICCGANQRITIGNDFTCYGCIFRLHEDDAEIKIGNDCLFSNSISFWATDGHALLDTRTDKIMNPITHAIEIGNHVWIGEGVKVLKNSRISDNSMVGAASVVCKRFNQTNVAIAGNPARVIRDGIDWNRLTPSALEKQRNGNK